MIMKKILLGLFIGFISLLCVKNTYAVSDHVEIISAPFSNGSYTQNLCSNFDCTPYSYVTISTNNLTGFSTNTWFGLSYRSVYFCNFRFSYVSSQTCAVDFSTMGTSTVVSFYNFSNTMTGDIILTFSENGPSSGGSTPAPEPCPEPEPCDCDDIFIVGLFREGFWGVATAIVTLIIPVLALFLVFRLVHGLIYGKGV